MNSGPKTPEEYIELLPDDRKDAFSDLRRTIRENLPPGFEEVISSGMITYVVPHLLYPSGYHSNPKLPLPFISIASQKNYISLYHMGLLANQELLSWFKEEFPKYSRRKLDIGKSCIRFKDIDNIPYELIGRLSTQMTPEQWIALYETIKPKK